MPISMPHWRLTLATLFHSLIGYSIFFDKTILNPVELFVKQFANQSILAHYGVQMSKQTIEWVWAGTSSMFKILFCMPC